MSYKLFPDLLDTNSSKRDLAIIGLCEGLKSEHQDFLYKILRQILTEPKKELALHKQARKCFIENFNDSLQNINLVYIQYNDSNCLTKINNIRKELNQITPAAELITNDPENFKSNQIRFFNAEDRSNADTLKKSIQNIIGDINFHIEIVGLLKDKNKPAGQLEAWFNSKICNK